MKIILYLAILLLLFSCNENTALTDAETAENEPATGVTSPGHTSGALPEIKSEEAIKAAYAEVVSKLKSGSMDSTSFGYDCNGEKSGQVTYFSDNGQLRLIRHTYNAYSHFSAIDEYFLKNDSLYFVFSKQVAWSFADQNKTKDNVTENRTYIIGNKAVKCLQKKYTILADANDATKAETSMGANKQVACTSLNAVANELAQLLELRTKNPEAKTCLPGIVT
ncbi:hypothetical protein [Pontibacter arcticus]|uniref:Lipoprotein n=1 Tax=Pontibacter arcticus TaxID=2080288 RepID=A0A364RDZ4_9BACT|nr:hypothetical protein [Pontibacter arcticus]RAU82570.1 hypothetical protein DP923_12435 [Pontibacter arcticus]